MSTATQEIAKSTSVLPADLRKLQLRNLRLEGTFSRSLEGTHREMAAPARSHRTLPDVLTHRQTTEVVRSRSLILTACSMKDLSVDRPLNDVEVVDLSNNQFEDIPSDVLAAQLSVKKLYLHANRFTSLSDSFEHLSALTELYLGYNNISWLSPKALNGLSQLRRLELNNNELAELPTGIGNLSNLEYLNVSFNQLQTLPSTVSRLAALRVLLLENNKLVTLPMSLGTLDSLERLSLASNPLVSPPIDVVARGAQAVVEYLRADIQGRVLLFLFFFASLGYYIWSVWWVLLCVIVAILTAVPVYPFYFCFFSVVEPEALFCAAEGDGLHSATAGAPAHLTVHAIDRFGRQAPRGGHDFALFLVGPSDRVEIGGEDSDNGQYALWYRAEVAGSYEVHLTLAGAHVNGSPFAVTVSPGMFVCPPPLLSFFLARDSFGIKSISVLFLSFVVSQVQPILRPAV